MKPAFAVILAIAVVLAWYMLRDFDDTPRPTAPVDADVAVTNSPGEETESDDSQVVSAPSGQPHARGTIVDYETGEAVTGRPAAPRR